MVHGNRFLLISLMAVMLPMLISVAPQESRVNQKKIDQKKAKKQKAAMNDYNQAVKRHNNSQSKSTKASMKKTKKESKNMTPSLH